MDPEQLRQLLGDRYLPFLPAFERKAQFALSRNSHRPQIEI